MTKDKRIAVRLTEEDLDQLKKVNENVSKAIRILINDHKKAQK